MASAKWQEIACGNDYDPKVYKGQGTQLCKEKVFNFLAFDFSNEWILPRPTKECIAGFLITFSVIEVTGGCNELVFQWPQVIGEEKLKRPCKGK